MTKIVTATQDDIAYVDHLRARESEAVGFIPRRRYEMEISGERQGDVLLIVENTEPVGFCYVTYGGLSAKIQQIAIQEDARRMERASALIEWIRAKAEKLGLPEMGCRCAEDLESNEFWQILGFVKVADAMGKSVYSRGKAKLGRRGRHINIYRRGTGLYEARLIDAV